MNYVTDLSSYGMNISMLAFFTLHKKWEQRQLIKDDTIDLPKAKTYISLIFMSHMWYMMKFLSVAVPHRAYQYRIILGLCNMIHNVELSQQRNG